MNNTRWEAAEKRKRSQGINGSLFFSRFAPRAPRTAIQPLRKYITKKNDARRKKIREGIDLHGNGVIFTTRIGVPTRGDPRSHLKQIASRRGCAAAANGSEKKNLSHLKK